MAICGKTSPSSPLFFIFPTPLSLFSLSSSNCFLVLVLLFFLFFSLPLCLLPLPQFALSVPLHPPLQLECFLFFTSPSSFFFSISSAALSVCLSVSLSLPLSFSLAQVSIDEWTLNPSVLSSVSPSSCLSFTSFLAEEGKSHGVCLAFGRRYGGYGRSGRWWYGYECSDFLLQKLYQRDPAPH